MNNNQTPVATGDSFSRRNVFIGLGAMVAAGSAAAAAEASTLEDDAERVRASMEARHGGQWSVDIDHDDHFVLIWRETAAASATPAPATQEEYLGQRVHDLAAELSVALALLDGGKWMVRVSPPFHGTPNYSLQPAELPPVARLQQGLVIARSALETMRPEGWWHTAYDVDLGLAVLTWHERRPAKPPMEMSLSGMRLAGGL